MAAPHVIPIPCLRDNYAYLLFDPAGEGECVVVDPSEAAPVQTEVRRRGLQLVAILNTHHHWDHVGGNQQLCAASSLQVFASATDRTRISGVTSPLQHGDRFSVAGMTFDVLHVPGHTLGALAYCCGDACFTGDTLFCGGCGRLFEGTPAQMLHSLTMVLGDLREATQIYCGHEYTEQNLEFARAICAHEALVARLEDVRARRRRGEFCASASLGLERETNPFLRCHLEEMQQALGVRGELEAFTELRHRKNSA